MTGIEIIFYGIFINITIALKCRFLGGNRNSILLTLLLLNVVLFFLYLYQFGFSIISLALVVVLNFIYGLLYFEIHSR
ncbi:hypothetical protein J2S11_004465 [Bacillus horti]|uniref:Uncharacterized protein n=1 Tax=Caldalkalibacillus horti TaxID=77523 RepID=A0ABT9W5H9_9BACI|nr:hypothetical protein [Bacillus horti]